MFLRTATIKQPPSDWAARVAKDASEYAMTRDVANLLMGATSLHHLLVAGSVFGWGKPFEHPGKFRRRVTFSERRTKGPWQLRQVDATVFIWAIGSWLLLQSLIVLRLGP